MTFDLSGRWVLDQVGGLTTVTSVVGSVAVWVVAHVAVEVPIPAGLDKPA